MSIDPLRFSSQRLRLFGLSSGLDIDQMVSQLMQVARAPLDRLEQRRQVLIWQKEDYLALAGSVDQVRQALAPLKLTSTFQARAASSSNEAVVTATAAPGTATGNYTLQVSRLAQGVQLGSSDVISLSPPNRTNLWAQFGIDPGASPSVRLTLRVTDSRGTREQQFSFSYSANDDIYDVVRAINGSSLGITVSYDEQLDRLFVSSRETGAAVTLTVVEDATVTMAGGGTRALWTDLFKLPSTASGQDAEFSLNGITGLKQPTNQFTIAGVTYQLKGVGTATVTVSQDTDRVVQTIKSFVEAYNEALGKMNAEIRERRAYDFPPLTQAQKQEMKEEDIKAWEEKARQGLLQGDMLLVSITSKLRRDVASPVTGTNSRYSSLSAIGITTGLYSEGGKLYVDEAKLREALTADPDGVMALFTAAGSSWESKGLAVRLSETLNDAINRIRSRAGVSGLYADNSELGRQIQLVQDQMDRMEERLARLEEQYYRQFTLMEQVLAQFSSQAAWLSQAFAPRS